MELEDDHVDDLFSGSEDDYGARGGQQKPKANASASLDDQMQDLTRHATKMKLTDSLAGQQPQDSRERDKSNRATTEQVLDKRTRIILLQAINQNIVSEIYGCVSTGKEANVYHAVTASEDERDPTIHHRAIKIYKTSILSFKNRMKYVEGDFRYQGGYNKSSNRGMVRQWAEKEMRNLRRIHAAGIPCPEPIHLRLHVLVMGFLGDRKGIPAPRLKDVVLEGDDVPQRWHALYVQLLGYMRQLYQQCRLVHADLSEYNVLYHQDKLYLIDVSQSVEHDHPESLNFLRSDIKNVNEFFGRQGVEVASDERMFDFVTSKGDLSTSELFQDIETSQTDTEVFRHQHIPRTLQEVEANNIGGEESAAYHRLLADTSLPSLGSGPKASGRSDTDGDTSLSEDDSSANESSGGAGLPRTPRGKRFQAKDEKRAHKQAVKEENREKRQKKMPKYVKKRLVKETAHRKN